MNRALLIICLFLSSVPGASSAKGCLKRSDLRGYQELVDLTFRAKDSSPFPNLYEKFCADNRSLIACHKEKVGGSKAQERASKWAGIHVCGEVFNLSPKTAPDAILYFFDQK